MRRLLAEVRACRICEEHLPLGPNPILRAHRDACLLIVGQAPGTRVHETGVPWDDPSGDRLREWLGIDHDTFYDERRIAIIPMAFCYPGRGKSGDLPPRPECFDHWHHRLLAKLPNVKLTLLVGQYAHAGYLGERRKKTLTATVQAFEEFLPEFLPLPHPSPRNNIWLSKNAWFEGGWLPRASLTFSCATPWSSCCSASGSRRAGSSDSTSTNTS